MILLCFVFLFLTSRSYSVTLAWRVTTHFFLRSVGKAHIWKCALLWYDKRRRYFTGTSFRLVTAPLGATSTLSESGLWLGCFVFVPLGTCGRSNRALKLSWLQAVARGLSLLVSWWSVEGVWIIIPARLLHWSPGMSDRHLRMGMILALDQIWFLRLLDVFEDQHSAPLRCRRSPFRGRWWRTSSSPGPDKMLYPCCVCCYPFCGVMLTL